LCPKGHVTFKAPQSTVIDGMYAASSCVITHLRGVRNLSKYKSDNLKDEASV